jgi:hypothetical protein
MDGPRYLTVDDVREYLRFPTGKSKAHRNDAVYAAMSSGRIPNWCICRRGGRVLFDRLAIDEWLHEGTQRVDPKQRAREILADVRRKKVSA